jgi:hypothetical protein
MHMIFNKWKVVCTISIQRGYALILKKKVMYPGHRDIFVLGPPLHGGGVYSNDDRMPVYKALAGHYSFRD